MTVLEYLNQNGYKFQVKGKEATLDLCPFCKHENSRNRFLVNLETGAYICNRQSSCGAKGYFKLDNVESKNATALDENSKKIVLKSSDFEPMTSHMVEYLKIRGISYETARKARVLSNKKGALCFFYTNRAGGLIGVKYRTIPKEGEKKKIWAEPGSVMTLLNWDRVPKDAERLYITEGECFKGDVQVFTEKGFIRFDMLKDEKVLQVENNFSGTFVKPLAKIKKYIDDELIVMRSGRNNWEHTSTKGHNIVINQNGTIKKMPVEKVAKGINGVIPTVINFNGEGTGLSKDEIALIIAVSADSKWDVRKNGDNYFHFGLKKQRKIQRLKELLERLNIQYTSFEKEYGYTTFNFISSTIKKGLPKEWVYKMNLEERKFFIEELKNWDGNEVKGKNQYEFSSKLLEENEIVQAIAHTCGYMSTIIKRKNKFGEWYKTSILLNKQSVSWQRDKSKREKYKGEVYCVTVPTGMLLVRINGKITITGNCDMLSLMEIGYENVVSVPNGTKSQEWIELHYEWLQKFKEIVLIMDNDKAGETALKTISDRLQGEKCKIFRVDLMFYKDPNEVLSEEQGKIKLKNILENRIEEIIQAEVIDIAEVDGNINQEAKDWGDRAFNALTGGKRKGEVILITGNPGSGKSAFLNMLMCNVIDIGEKVYTMQGEFTPNKFKQNIMKILCRPSHIETVKNIFKDKIYGRVSKQVEEKINTWLKGKLYIHKNQVPKRAELLKSMQSAYKKYGVENFFIDNLMTINLEGNPSDKYDKQRDLFIELQEFAKSKQVTIAVVAHPRKNSIVNLEDADMGVVSGASEIVNLANYAIFLKRLNEKEIDLLEEKGVIASVGAKNLKDREFGDINLKAYWNYEVKTGRFLDVKGQEKSKNKMYGWEKDSQVTLSIQAIPFE